MPSLPGSRRPPSSIVNERRPGDRDVINLMLAHVPKDKMEAAYDRARAQHMERRRAITEEGQASC